MFFFFGGFFSQGLASFAFWGRGGGFLPPSPLSFLLVYTLGGRLQFRVFFDRLCALKMPSNPRFSCPPPPPFLFRIPLPSLSLNGPSPSRLGVVTDTHVPPPPRALDVDAQLQEPGVLQIVAQHGVDLVHALRPRLRGICCQGIPVTGRRSERRVCHDGVYLVDHLGWRV